ncbi:MAG TPA: DNA mismatch repair protein MutS, partial [Candidatus Kapabacteria bacterium]|nr:DNA mismatch repair protein MutS [Candidatus Kapabacteria bacterium]
QQNAENLATLDCLLSFATVARENNYTRPEIDTSEILEIEDCRHPVVEKMLPTGESFVPNSTKMNTSDNTIHIITGPNMSGKSCYLRQVGLIVLLGQMGSFVPAKRAKFGIVDRIFTRVGAQDNIPSGESTFLVEMQEAANIINNATRRSLILLDEVGRGTATFDGISIAWAIAEYIHNEIKAKTLFATHYHELNDMAERYAGIKNYRVEVIEADGNVVFTHKVSSGGSDHSFGIHVAQMAGLPAKIIERANEIMKSFEGAANEPQSEHKPDISRIKTRQKGQSHQQLSIFEFKDDALREKIKSIDVDNITPIEALKILNELKKEIK